MKIIKLLIALSMMLVVFGNMNVLAKYSSIKDKYGGADLSVDASKINGISTDKMFIVDLSSANISKKYDNNEVTETEYNDLNCIAYKLPKFGNETSKKQSIPGIITVIYKDGATDENRPKI